MKNHVVIVAILSLISLSACAENPKAAGGVLYSKWHKSLLEKWANATTFPPEKQAQVNEIKTRITILSEKLLEEEVKLNMLKYKKYELQDNFTWFFDPELRKKVDEEQLEINEQERVVQRLLDEIELEWKALKPLYGLFSKMFMAEALGFITYFVDFCVGLLATLLEMGFISLLIFGPVTGLAVAAWTWMGLRVLPFIATLFLFFIDIYWIFKLPFIMIQYNPTVPEFLAVYLTIIGIMILITNVLLRLLFPEQQAKAVLAPRTPVHVPIESE